jgi:hypothetical protein
MLSIFKKINYKNIINKIPLFLAVAIECFFLVLLLFTLVSILRSDNYFELVKYNLAIILEVFTLFSIKKIK